MVEEITYEPFPKQVDVTDLMDIPDTGGRDDEIGGHVDMPPAPDVERTECPDCGSDVSTDAIGHVCADGYRDHEEGRPGTPLPPTGAE